MDTLSTLDTNMDIRRWLKENPVALASVRWIQALRDRSLDEDGRALARRIVSAILAGLTEIKPAELAPRAHATIYHRIRDIAWLTLIGLNIAEVAGVDGPLMNESASVALQSIEQQDVLQITASGRATALARVLAGLSWREDL